MKRVLRVHARPEGRAYVHARAACPPKLAREHHERRRKARAYALCLICALCLIGAATIGAQQIPTAPRPGGIAAPAPPATDVATKKPGVIRGRVLLANGRPARRALVSLAVVNGFPRMVKADLDGRYELTQVLPGDYRVSAGKPGYLVLESVGVPRQQAALIGMGLIATVRFAAIRWELELPVLEVNE